MNILNICCLVSQKHVIGNTVRHDTNHIFWWRKHFVQNSTVMGVLGVMEDHPCRGTSGFLGSLATGCCLLVLQVTGNTMSALDFKCFSSQRRTFVLFGLS